MNEKAREGAVKPIMADVKAARSLIGSALRKAADCDTGQDLQLRSLLEAFALTAISLQRTLERMHDGFEMFTGDLVDIGVMGFGGWLYEPLSNPRDKS